jgi:hypothetical protein
MPIELTPEQKGYESSLSREELKKAIYIDFEGFEDRPPTLLGCRVDRHFVQVVFDRTLQSAASAKGLFVADSKTTVADLLTRAKHERRRCVFTVR